MAFWTDGRLKRFCFREKDHEFSCCISLPEKNTTDWMSQTTETYFAIVLETGSPRSRCS